MFASLQRVCELSCRKVARRGRTSMCSKAEDDTSEDAASTGARRRLRLRKRRFACARADEGSLPSFEQPLLLSIRPVTRMQRGHAAFVLVRNKPAVQGREPDIVASTRFRRSVCADAGALSMPQRRESPNAGKAPTRGAELISPEAHGRLTTCPKALCDEREGRVGLRLTTTFSERCSLMIGTVK